MIYDNEEAIVALSEISARNTRDIKQKNRQRRNQPVDLYGIEYTRQGDGGAPAAFYISVSSDMIYLERFEFKLIVQPFVSTVSNNGIQSAVVDVVPTSLSVSGTSITPNPHDHSTNPHTHNVVSGISMTHTTASDFRISAEGIDVTPYLAAQYNAWIDGEGVYPSLDISKNYDLLEVASDLRDEGKTAQASLLTRAGYKRIEISSASPFQVTLVNYLKYPHLNR